MKAIEQHTLIHAIAFAGGPSRPDRQLDISFGPKWPSYGRFHEMVNP